MILDVFHIVVADVHWKVMFENALHSSKKSLPTMEARNSNFCFRYASGRFGGSFGEVPNPLKNLVGTTGFEPVTR